MTNVANKLTKISLTRSVHHRHFSIFINPRVYIKIREIQDPPPPMCFEYLSANGNIFCELRLDYARLLKPLLRCLLFRVFRDGSHKKGNNKHRQMFKPPWIKNSLGIRSRCYSNIYQKPKCLFSRVKWKVYSYRPLKDRYANQLGI